MNDIPYTIQINIIGAIHIRIALNLALDDHRGDAFGKKQAHHSRHLPAQFGYSKIQSVSV